MTDNKHLQQLIDATHSAVLPKTILVSSSKVAGLVRLQVDYRDGESGELLLNLEMAEKLASGILAACAHLRGETTAMRYED